MKKFTLLAIVFLFMFTGIAFAELRVVCDPVDAETVDKYFVEIDGVETIAGIETIGDTVRLNHIVEDLPMGWHTLKAKAGNDFGQESDWSELLRFHNKVPVPKIRIIIEISNI